MAAQNPDIIFVPQTNPLIPQIPHMADLGDILSNFANNWFHLRYVFAVLFGIMFAFYLIGKIMEQYKGEQREAAWFEKLESRAGMRDFVHSRSAVLRAGMKEKLWRSNQDSMNDYREKTAEARQNFKHKMFQRDLQYKTAIRTENWAESFHVKNRVKIDAWKDTTVEKLEFKDKLKYG